ncbi:PIN domain-like protein, partial [Dendrothele bispora CBS 962.96]
LANVFYKLSFFLSLPLVLVFVFDGPLRPGKKRSKRVGAAAHWMTQPFKELVLAFGYHTHQAPGEAEAELARMSTTGFIDAVLTDDSDALLFGARLVIRRWVYFPHIRRDPDSIATYYTDNFAQDPDKPIMHGGMLLFAILQGGDYSKGLHRCGQDTAYRLTHTELGSELLLAADEDNETLSTFLPAWRAKLRHYLADDPYGLIGQKNKKLAAGVPNDFPSMEIVKLYTNPLVSESSWTSNASWHVFQLPNLANLSILVERLFLWRSTGLAENKLQSKVFGAFCIKYLLMVWLCSVVYWPVY